MYTYLYLFNFVLFSFGLNVHIPDQLRKTCGKKVECFHQKAVEVAKAKNFNVYANPFAIQMHALKAIHDAVLEGNK